MKSCLIKKRTSVISTGWCLIGFFSLALSLSSAGCGFYGPPRPPEVFAPKAVIDLTAYATLEGVHFKWKSPDTDAKGDKLRSMDGYYLYRKQIEADADIIDDRIEFELLDTIEDTHIELLEELQEQARLEGKITRNVKVEDEFKNFSFDDTSPEPGKTYLYKVVPFNQGDVEGEVRQFIKVVFRGDASTVSIVDSAGRETGGGGGGEDFKTPKAAASSLF